MMPLPVVRMKLLSLNGHLFADEPESYGSLVGPSSYTYSGRESLGISEMGLLWALHELSASKQWCRQPVAWPRSLFIHHHRPLWWNRRRCSLTKHQLSSDEVMLWCCRAYSRAVGRVPEMTLAEDAILTRLTYMPPTQVAVHRLLRPIAIWW